MREISLANVADHVGDDDFEQLFKEHYSCFVRHAVKVLGDLAEAEEVASEAFIKLIREKREIRNRAGWLKKCVLHLALDKLRSNQRRSRREEQATSSLDASDPERGLILRQQQRMVRHVLSELSSQDAVLLLARAEGYSYQEAAELAGVRVTSTGSMLLRAERRFKEKYEELYGHE